MTKNRLGKQAFSNGFKYGTAEYREAKRYLARILADLAIYSQMPDPYDYTDQHEAHELSEWSEYGLSFEPFVSGKTDFVCYYRFIISFGGPTAELRMYPDGSIHAVFLDWFKGIAWDITHAPAAQWAYDQFYDSMVWGQYENI